MLYCYILEREEVDEENWGIFHSSECYLVSYTYETPKGRPERYVFTYELFRIIRIIYRINYNLFIFSYIYYWLGNSAGPAAETAAAFQTVSLRVRKLILCNQKYYK